MEVLQQLEPLMREIIAPNAAQIDEQARYPRAALDALAAAGLLGLISASEVGGRGKGLAEAVQVVERIAPDHALLRRGADRALCR
jgi:alkylation response protein AidB-like acyl-CoA dehydrogenase